MNRAVKCVGMLQKNPSNFILNAPAAYNITSDYNISLGEVEFVMAVPTKANVSVFGNVCEEYGDEPCPFVVSQGTSNLHRRVGGQTGP